MKAVSWGEIHGVVVNGDGGYVATLDTNTYFIPYEFRYVDSCVISTDYQPTINIDLLSTPSIDNIKKYQYWLKKIRINEDGVITFYFNRGDDEYSREFWTLPDKSENPMMAYCSAYKAPANLDVFGKLMHYIVQKNRINCSEGVTAYG